MTDLDRLFTAILTPPGPATRALMRYADDHRDHHPSTDEIVAFQAGMRAILGVIVAAPDLAGAFAAAVVAEDAHDPALLLSPEDLAAWAAEEAATLRALWEAAA